MKNTLALFAALTTLPGLAHDGHGLFGTHVHTSDALGFVAVVVLLAVAVWLSKRSDQ